MQKEYKPTQIEDRWRDNWFKDNIYEAVDFSKKPKKYILAELPYPSGKFLHVGHMMRYTVPEIYSRFLRMRGYNVLYPMGWDCFGLPAETFAIKEGITPQEAIKKAVKSFKSSLQRMGYAFDWSREISTSDPKFYKWTQLTFKKLWEQGLAELQEMPVWWCEELGVLADEEVISTSEGDWKVSERGGHKVERKMLKQWVLKLPDYAERLLEGLNRVDYEDSVKQAQRNWIGRSEGINISYDLVGLNEKLICFTTTPVNFGATFIVISPEHSLVSKLTAPSQIQKVADYVRKSASLSDLQKQQKEKSGVFTGSYAVNHLNGAKIPIWIADFVLSNVGTGAVQGCPGHDERDFEFATKYGIPIKRVVVGLDGDTSAIDIKEKIISKGMPGKMINSEFLNGLEFSKAMDKTKEYFVEKGWGECVVTYKMRNQIFSRQRYWGEPIPLIHTKEGRVESVPDEELPLELPIMEDFLPGKDGKSPLKRAEKWVNTVDSKGMPAIRDTDTMPTWAGSNWYYLRYIDPHNDKELVDMEKAKYWMPVDKYFGDSGHTTVHMLYSRFWYKFLYDQGLVPNDEPYNYRMSGGLLLGADGNKMSKSAGNTLDPKEVVDSYGADAVRTYLAFIGPYEETYPWSEQGLVACYKLLRTINGLREIVSKETKEINDRTETSLAYHKMVKNMTGMMESLKMNTSVSEIMIFTNHLKALKVIPGDIWEQFIKIIAPFAPFLAEDLWQEFHDYKGWKKENSVHLQDWPKFDASLAEGIETNIPIQINGKRRGELSVALDKISDKEFILKQAKVEVEKYLDGQNIKKEIYVEGKIVNFVVGKQ